VQSSNFLSGIIVLAVISFLFACASPKPLSGGPKDALPPRILDYESTPNKQTNFHQKEITITFDEWIELKGVDQQLVISPLMPKKPEIKQKGKSIIITLPDSLRENTTYTLNFGNAIQDLNEGNKLENFSFIFSTGDFLDSIKLSGIVTDATTLKPSPDTWVMLYPTGLDDIVYSKQPEYVTKTNKEGAWSISNVRSDSFLVVALKDENLNFVYDLDNELFGWLDQNQISTVSATLPDIQVSARAARPIVKEIVQIAPGLMYAIIPGPFPKTLPVFQPPLDSAHFEWVGDSLYIWSSQDVNYSGNIILGTDTTHIRQVETKYLKNKPLILSSLTSRMHSGDAVSIKSNVPVRSFDQTLIQLSKDTIASIPFHIEKDSVSERILHIHSNWIPASRYIMKFLPGAITDIWGRASDSFNFSFVVTPQDQFSNLNMKIAGLDSTTNYVVQVMTGNVINHKFFIHQQSSAEVISRGMDPGKYIIELIEDRNNNGTWDPGNFNLRRQPERKMIFTPDNLRAGWDVEMTMEWK
jgi:hypothetical protein